ncbi:MAG: hypothetical protein H6713_12680 [Myxococcales bacterium]|nr:hypothetical protein [Myxococcales bacterium]MCB9750834.1 hypothetical protein [Myxococcales bacterium]
MHREVWILLSTLLAWPLPAVAAAPDEAPADADAGDADDAGDAGDDASPEEAPETSVHVCLSDDSIEGEIMLPEPMGGPPPDIGPCLDMPAEPCLSIVEPRAGRCDVAAPGEDDGLPALLAGGLLLTAAARRRRRAIERLERAGVLPEDVLARLRSRDE